MKNHFVFENYREEIRVICPFSDDLSRELRIIFFKYFDGETRACDGLKGRKGPVEREKGRMREKYGERESCVGLNVSVGRRSGKGEAGIKRGEREKRGSRRWRKRKGKGAEGDRPTKWTCHYALTKAGYSAIHKLISMQASSLP